MNAKTYMKCKSGEIISGHINPEIVFGRALVLANSRDDVTIDNILSHPIGPIPVAMFHKDGTMRKSCKSDLVKQFENEVSPVLSLPDFDPSLTTSIRDDMTLVQCMDVKRHITFGDLATDYCRELTSCFAKAHTVADVFDRYDVNNFIKSAERERRTKVTAHTKVFQVIESRNIPDWKEFLSVKENKQALINVFGDFIVKFNQSNPLGALWKSVLHCRFIWKSGNCESCFRSGSLWLSWLVQHSRRGRHSYDPPGFTCWQKAQRIGKARRDHYRNLWYRCDCSLYLFL